MLLRLGLALTLGLDNAGLSKSQLESALTAVRGENKTVDSRSSDQQFEALTKYGTDLTAKAAHLDPIIGRDEEVRHLKCCQIKVWCQALHVPMPNPGMPAAFASELHHSRLMLDISSTETCWHCRFGASFASSRGAPRTTRCSSASLVRPLDAMGRRTRN